MKKTFVITAVLFLALAGSAFAKDLNNLEGLVSLSNNVSGTYFSNSTSGTSEDATNFVISTGHAQGNMVYGTGNFTTSIFRNEIAGDVFDSTDLVTADPSSWDDSTAFNGWTEM